MMVYHCLMAKHCRRAGSISKIWPNWGPPPPGFGLRRGVHQASGGRLRHGPGVPALEDQGGDVREVDRGLSNKREGRDVSMSVQIHFTMFFLHPIPLQVVLLDHGVHHEGGHQEAEDRGHQQRVREVVLEHVKGLGGHHPGVEHVRPVG